ncbi:MAG: RimK family alpha-L-glutamate ligase [Acidobacteriota bacterium]|nr:RimK family alpha-L-glutamate ligase [Acidobacteriota bacterium]
MTPVRPEPFPLIGFARLFRMAMAGEDLVPLRTELIERASQAPDDANTLLDVSWALQLTWNREVGLDVQAQALRMQQLYHLPAPSGRTGLRLLVLMGPGDLMANTPVECLLEESDVAVDLLFTGPDLPWPAVVPAHDVLFVAVGENDQNRPLLEQLAGRLRDWPRPVVNRPEQILTLSRVGVSERLQGAGGIAMPSIRRIPRDWLAALADGRVPLGDVLPGAAFPIVVRPADSHAGQGLEKLETPAALGPYLAAQAGADFYLSPFLDYRSADGLFRKYRIALIDGRPFVAHVGIAAHWMIHYLNAGMAESAAKRAEEAAIMETFDEGFGRRHAAAFRAIHERLGVEYLGIDCAETPDGRLLVFEADNCMVMHAMDPVDLFPYKPPQMRKLFGAFRTMLAGAAARLPAQPLPVARRA